jgi:hypothetical protein
MVDPCVPRWASVHPRLQDDAPLTHGGRTRHWLGFPSGEPPWGEGVEDRVTPRGGQRGPRQDRADLGPPTAEMACPGPLAALVVARSAPHPRGDWVRVEPAPCRPRGVQGGGEPRPAPGSRWSEVIGRPPGRAGTDARGARLSRRGHQVLAVVQMPRAVGPHRRVRQRDAMALGHPHLQAWAPPLQPGLHGRRGRVGERTGRAAHDCGDVGDAPGIERLGRRQWPGRLGNVTDVARVHHRQGPWAPGAGGHQGALPAARHVEDHPQPYRPTVQVVSSYAEGASPGGPIVDRRARGSGHGSGACRKRRDDPASVRSPRLPMGTVSHASQTIQAWHRGVLL